MKQDDAMHRSFWIALVLCAGCAHRELEPLDAVTTTAATFAGPATPRVDALDSAYAAYEAEHEGRPAPVPSTAPTDAQVAAAFETDESRARVSADAARAHARDGQVRAFASFVYDRMRDARTRLDLLVPAPDVTAPPAELEAVAGQSFIDFDRVYVDVQLRQATEMLQKLDRLLPFVKDVRVKQELMDLRPLLDDIYARAFALQQTVR